MKQKFPNEEYLIPRISINVEKGEDGMYNEDYSLYVLTLLFQLFIFHLSLVHKGLIFFIRFGALSYITGSSSILQLLFSVNCDS